MNAIAIYVLGLLTLPAMALVLIALTELFHRDARWCPYCMEWIIGSKDDPNRTVLMPHVVVLLAGLVHGMSARHRAWRRVHRLFGFDPSAPSDAIRIENVDEIRPLDRFEEGCQMVEYGIHGKSLDGGARGASCEAAVEAPWIECLFDGRPMEGWGIRMPDGSMELWVDRHSTEDPRRIPLFDRNAKPNPHVRPMKE